MSCILPHCEGDRIKGLTASWVSRQYIRVQDHEMMVHLSWMHGPVGILPLKTTQPKTSSDIVRCPEGGKEKGERHTRLTFGFFHFNESACGRYTSVVEVIGQPHGVSFPLLPLRRSRGSDWGHPACTVGPPSAELSPKLCFCLWLSLQSLRDGAVAPHFRDGPELGPSRHIQWKPCRHGLGPPFFSPVNGGVSVVWSTYCPHQSPGAGFQTRALSPA